MSTREIALGIFNQLTDDQLKGFISMFSEYYPIFNDETKAAFEEVKDMEAHPKKYKSYNSFSEILSEIDEEIANET